MEWIIQEIERFVEWPRKLLFIGSGITKTPDEWLAIPSIRVNNRTFGKFPSNRVFGVMTWPSAIDEGSGGVFPSPLYTARTELGDRPYVFVFDMHTTREQIDKFYQPKHHLFCLGVADRFESPAFLPYIQFSKQMGYVPRNSTGSYIILWLLYADVNEIYISGFDGYKMLSGSVPGQWDTDKPYYDINGNEWVPRDNREIAARGNQSDNPKDFYFHNLYVEWLAIEDAIEKARARGVKVFISKEQP